jgi:hypothetical protein
MRLNLWFLCIAFSATFKYNVKHIEIETWVENCWNTPRPCRTIEAEPVGITATSTVVSTSSKASNNT